MWSLDLEDCCVYRSLLGYFFQVLIFFSLMREYIYLIVVPHQLDHGLYIIVGGVNKLNFEYVCVWLTNKYADLLMLNEAIANCTLIFRKFANNAKYSAWYFLEIGCMSIFVYFYVNYYFFPSLWFLSEFSYRQCYDPSICIRHGCVQWHILGWSLTKKAKCNSNHATS